MAEDKIGLNYEDLKRLNLLDFKMFKRGKKKTANKVVTLWQTRNPHRHYFEHEGSFYLVRLHLHTVVLDSDKPSITGPLWYDEVEHEGITLRGHFHLFFNSIPVTFIRRTQTRPEPPLSQITIEHRQDMVRFCWRLFRDAVILVIISALLVLMILRWT